MHEYNIAKNEIEYEAAAQVCKEYAAWLNIDLCFQGFEKELGNLHQMYGSPYGGIILCKIENSYVGCVGIRKLDQSICELKRMYVQPAYRQLAIGKELLHQAIALAKKYNYSSIRLDTLSHMQPAINLYKKYGFVEIKPYYFNPEPTALFFELLIG